MHEGSPFQTTLLNDTRRAQIKSNAGEFGINENTPYNKLSDKQKNIINLKVENKLQESRFTKNMDRGYVYDRKTGTVVDTEEMLNKISQRDYVPIQRLD